MLWVLLAQSDSITAGAISTDGYTSAIVTCSTNIDVMGDIITKSENGPANILMDYGNIWAVNVTTSANGLASVRAYNGIDVKRNLYAYSLTDSAYVDLTGTGTIKAFRVNTLAYKDAGIKTTSGDIKVIGVIRTKSTSGPANIETTDGNIKAECIFSQGSTSAYVKSSWLDIDVKDIVSVSSGSGNAYVSADNDLKAILVETNANNSGYVTALQGDIDVKTDIRTTSLAGAAYVKASNGNVVARTIKATGASGFDNSVQSASGSGKFMLFPNSNETSKTIKDADFYLDTDRTWKTSMTIEGTCTLNGNGNKLLLSDVGGFVVSAGGSLTLKNILIEDLGGNVIRCENNTGDLFMRDVTLTQSSDVVWSTGTLQIFGNCNVKSKEGLTTTFTYDSTATSTIHQNSELTMRDGATFCYATTNPGRLAMIDSSSRIKLDNGELHAFENLTLTNGTLVVEREGTVMIRSGKTMSFGNGNAADNFVSEYHLRSQFVVDGTLVNNNA
jgi:hypothetical protein